MPVRVDDGSIGDDEILWRRLIPAWIVRNPDGTFLRASSAAFDDGIDGEVSVHLASLTTTDRVLEGRRDDSVVALPARFPRSLGHVVVRDPKPDDPSHALICPPPGLRGKRKRKDALLMAKEAGLVTGPAFS